MMAAYAYKAVDRSGHLVRGVTDAADVDDLDRRLSQMGLDLVRGAPARPGRRGAGPRLRRRQLVHFCFHLEQLTRAGVPLIDGLADLRDSVESRQLQTLAAGIAEAISGGRTLSGALAAYPASFDRVFVGLVRAGEESGHLPEVLARLGESLRWQDELAAQARRAAAYPLLVGVLLLAATAFLMVALVPQIRQLVRGFGLVLPASTRALFAVSDFLVAYGIPVSVLAAGVWAALYFGLRDHPVAGPRIDRIKLALPWLGNLLRKYAMSRFVDTFALLYAAGIPVVDALQTATGVVGNRALLRGLDDAGGAIAAGRGIAAAFREAGLFPPLVVRMLHVGEQTGRLDMTLRDVAYFYDRDVREAAARAQAVAEPALTAVLGALIGWVMLSLLGPIYDLIAGFGG